MREADFASHVPAGPRSAIQAVTPLTARLLWGYGVAPRDRKAELLQALHEVVESVDMTVAADELFERMLEIAVGVTGAEGGSLMLLDPRANVLRIRVAQGVEPELWPKIRVELGQGISGRVAAEGRPIHLRGRADGANYDLLRERVDVESALCVPLIHHGKVLGVHQRPSFTARRCFFRRRPRLHGTARIPRCADHCPRARAREPP